MSEQRTNEAVPQNPNEIPSKIKEQYLFSCTKMTTQIHGCFWLRKTSAAIKWSTVFAIFSGFILNASSWKWVQKLQRSIIINWINAQTSDQKPSTNQIIECHKTVHIISKAGKPNSLHRLRPKIERVKESNSKTEFGESTEKHEERGISRHELNSTKNTRMESREVENRLLAKEPKPIMMPMLLISRKIGKVRGGLNIWVWIIDFDFSCCIIYRVPPRPNQSQAYATQTTSSLDQIRTALKVHLGFSGKQMLTQHSIIITNRKDQNTKMGLFAQKFSTKLVEFLGQKCAFKVEI